MKSSQVTVIEGIGEVDTSIASLVRLLNQLGFRTVYSCSGLWREHKNIDPAVNKLLVDGYICLSLEFLNSNQIEKIIQSAAIAGMRCPQKNGYLMVLTPSIYSIPEAYQHWVELQKEAERLALISGRSQDKRARTRRYNKFLRELVINSGNPVYDNVVDATWERFENHIILVNLP